MRIDRLVVIVAFTAVATGCAAKAQVPPEVALPLLDPPPPPPRMVAIYPEEPEFVPAPPAVEASSPTKPPVRPPRLEAKPEPAPVAQEPAPEAVTKPAVAPALTLTPSPGTEAQTAAAIRELLTRAGRDLGRVNAAALNNDGRTQLESARRFIQQAEEALKARNIVFAGKLADKAATMAAVLVR